MDSSGIKIIFGIVVVTFDRNFYIGGRYKPIFGIGYSGYQTGVIAAVKSPKIFARCKNRAQVGLGNRIIGPVFKRVELGNSHNRHNRNNGYGY